METIKCGACGAEVAGQALECPQCGKQLKESPGAPEKTDAGKKSSLVSKTKAFLGKAFRSMRSDYQVGGFKKLARNKYFIGACVLLVVFIVGGMQDSEKTRSHGGNDRAIASGETSTTESISLGKGGIPKEFLDSVVVTRYIQGKPVPDFGTSFTVRKMLTKFVNTKLHDGSYPKYLKWKTSSDTYTLPTEFGGRKVYLIFDHQQGTEWSVFKMKTPDGTAVEGEATQIITTLKLYE